MTRPMVLGEAEWKYHQEVINKVMPERRSRDDKPPAMHHHDTIEVVNDRWNEEAPETAANVSPKLPIWPGLLACRRLDRLLRSHLWEN